MTHENVVAIPRGYSEQEAAEILTAAGYAIKAETLRKHRQAGLITYRRIGGKIRYTAEDIEAYIEAGRIKCRDKQEEAHTRSAGTASHGSQEDEAGMRLGTMPILGAHAAEAWGKRI